MTKLTDRDFKLRLGTRGKVDKEGNALAWVLPHYAINGAIARSNQSMRGLGQFHFVCLPNSSYTPTEALP